MTVRISRHALGTAMTKVRAMNLVQKERLVDELVQAQPHMFGSFLVQKQLGVSIEKMDFLLELLLICFVAMKESGLDWPLITEDEQDRQMGRYVAMLKFGEGLDALLQERAMRQYIENHPEQDLLAFVVGETADWLKRITPDDTDQYVMLAAVNFVNCIACVPMPASR